MTGEVAKTATISPDGLYRYDLTRRWDSSLIETEFSHRLVLWMMLNPSTADASVDDNTIRRCMGFARSWGFGGIAVVNLFALRATNPDHLLHHPDPIGPENAETIKRWLDDDEVGRVVAAWGAWWKSQPNRSSRLNVEALARDAKRNLACLGKTVNGQPRHPLYVRADQPPETWP